MSDRISRFDVYHRHLPHWQYPGSTYFITFRLMDSGVCNLATPDIGPIILDAFQFFAGKRYWLGSHTVMPDHVHAVLRPIMTEDGTCVSLGRVMQSLKGYTSRKINELLKRSGALWLGESYDHIIRNHLELEEKETYIVENPVRAGLIDDATQWPWYRYGPDGTRQTERSQTK